MLTLPRYSGLANDILGRYLVVLSAFGILKRAEPPTFVTRYDLFDQSGPRKDSQTRFMMGFLVSDPIADVSMVMNSGKGRCSDGADCLAASWKSCLHSQPQSALPAALGL